MHSADNKNERNDFQKFRGIDVTSSQKTAVSLLLSVILFAIFSVIAFTGLFSVVDARFYEPGKISQIQKHLNVVSENYTDYISTLESKFGKSENSFLKQESVSSYIESRPSEESVLNRSKLAGELFEQMPGLLGMRLVDKNGINVHFSSFSSDVLRRTDELVSYKNYADLVSASGEKEIPFERIDSPDSFASGGTVCKTIFDGTENRIIFSFPFYDTYSAYRGTFLFYVNANDFNRVLLSKKLITFDGTGTLVSDLNDGGKDGSSSYKSGFVFGLPQLPGGRKIFEQEIISRWQQGMTSPEKIVYRKESGRFSEKEFESSLYEQKDENKYWILVSSEQTPFGYVGGIYPDEFFVMTDGAKILLLLCIFVTVFLAVFLLANLKQDDMAVIREKIRRLQLGIVTEFLKQKEAVDWKIVSGKIAERRQEVTSEIFKSLGRKGKKHTAEVNELINRSWDELLAALNVQHDRRDGGEQISNIDEIKALLEELLSSGSLQVNAVSKERTVPHVPVEAVSPSVERSNAPEENTRADGAEQIEEVEDLEELDELEEDGLEPLEEIPSTGADADDVEELEELEELDDADSGLEILAAENAGDGESAGGEFVDISDFFSEEGSAPSEKPVVIEAEIQSSDDVEILNKKAFSPETEYDKADDELIDSFSISNPDFSGLDLSEENGHKNESFPEENSEQKESDDGYVSLDEFDVAFDDDNREKPKDFDEVIGFGTEQPKPKHENAEPVPFDIEPEPMNFSQLDKTEDIKKRKKSDKEKLINETNNSIENIKNQVQAQAMTATDDVFELSAADMEIPFSFTKFASNSETPLELKPFANVIHEDDSGVFVIDSAGQEQEPENLEFKELVDSVLRAK